MSRTQLLVPWAPFWGLLGLDIGTGARKHQLGSDHRPVTGLGLCGLCQQPGQGLGPLDTNSRPAFSDNWSLAHSGPGLASGPKTWRPLSRAVGHSVSWPPEALVLIFPPEWVGVVTLSLVLRLGLISEVPESRFDHDSGESEEGEEEAGEGTPQSSALTEGDFVPDSPALSPIELKQELPKYLPALQVRNLPFVAHG